MNGLDPDGAPNVIHPDNLLKMADREGFLADVGSHFVRSLGAHTICEAVNFAVKYVFRLDRDEGNTIDVTPE